MASFEIYIPRRFAVQPSDCPPDSKLGQLYAREQEAAERWSAVEAERRELQKQLAAARTLLANPADLTIDQVTKAQAEAAIVEAKLARLAPELARLREEWARWDRELRRNMEANYRPLVSRWNAIRNPAYAPNSLRVVEWYRTLVQLDGQIEQFDGGASLVEDEPEAEPSQAATEEDIARLEAEVAAEVAAEQAARQAAADARAAEDERRAAERAAVFSGKRVYSKRPAQPAVEEIA